MKKSVDLISGPQAKKVSCILVISILSQISDNGYYNIVDRRCIGKVVLMIAIVLTQSTKFFCTVSPVQTIPLPTLTPIVVCGNHDRR